MTFTSGANADGRQSTASATCNGFSFDLRFLYGLRHRLAERWLCRLFWLVGAHGNAMQSFVKTLWAKGDGKHVVPLPRCRHGYLDFAPVRGGTDGYHGTWEIVGSRSCQRYVIVRATEGTRAWRLAKILATIPNKARFDGYVKRDNGWRMLPSRAEEFQRLYALNWDISPITGQLVAPRG